jgi:hypothetical protein
MRFMMIMLPKGYEQAKPGFVPDTKHVEAMMKYNEALQKAGVLLALDGLHPPSMGARISFAGGKPKVTDGPFAETKEVVGGYWIIQVKSKEEAVQWAMRCPGAENEVIEVRQVHEFADFPPELQKVADKLADRIRQTHCRPGPAGARCGARGRVGAGRTGCRVGAMAAVRDSGQSRCLAHDYGQTSRHRSTAPQHPGGA